MGHLLARRPWGLAGRVVIGCLSLIGLADLVMWRAELPLAVQALLDEGAHAATGLLGLAALTTRVDPRAILAMLAGSVLIDVDHIPGLLGWHVLDQGTDRPYTHSLLIVGTVGLGAVIFGRRYRRVFWLATFALLLHLLRDTGEPSGAGAPLLWPLTRRGYFLDYRWYAGCLLGLAVTALRSRTTTP